MTFNNYDHYNSFGRAVCCRVGGDIRIHEWSGAKGVLCQPQHQMLVRNKQKSSHIDARGVRAPLRKKAMGSRVGLCIWASLGVLSLADGVTSAVWHALGVADALLRVVDARDALEEPGVGRARLLADAEGRPVAPRARAVARLAAEHRVPEIVDQQKWAAKLTL